jgi:hypothetical protein
MFGKGPALPTMMLLGLTFPAAQSWSALAGRKPGSWKNSETNEKEI